MPCSPRSAARCPRCGTLISLTLAAQLQSEQLGVACDCPQCGHQWVYRIDQGISDDADHPVESLPHLNVPSHRESALPATPTVCVVEDDDAVRDALDGLLQSQGWQTALYASAEEFREHCRSLPPGCLLLDLHLPGMSGLELLSELQRTGNTVPVILMTESLDERLLRRADQSGSFACFPKPFNIKALLAGIRSALDRSAPRQQNRAQHPGQNQRGSTR